VQAEPEQSPTLEETFNDPVLEELSLKNSWTLWEHYESQGDRKMDYASSMCKACWFNDLVSFAVAWNQLPHRDLTNIFFNEASKTLKIVQVSGLPCRITGMSMFQSAVKPEWEDPVNKNGG